MITPIEWEYRYKALREVYREQHPRITDDAIDAFVDGKIAQAGVAAGLDGPADLQAVGEPGADTSGGVRLGDPPVA